MLLSSISKSLSRTRSHSPMGKPPPKSVLSLTLKSSRRTRDPMHSGIGPKKLLFSKSKYVKDVSSHIHLGIGPDSLFNLSLSVSAH
jgi:hypothetical protein